VAITDPAEVVLVAEGSAAATAGLRAGDRITEIGGREPAALGYFAVNDLLEASTPVQLTLDRDGTRIEAAIP